jgi:hypothetical protein
MIPDRDRVLFATPPSQHQRPVTIAGSLLVHALAGAVIWFSLVYKPPSTRVITDHYTVRELDMNALAEQMSQRIPYPPHPHTPAPAHKAQQAPPPPPKIQARLSPQTLIQPDLPNPITLSQQIPVPRIVLWSANKTVVKKIVPPLPQKPAAADVLPVLDRPNQELKLANVNVASSKLPSQKLPLTASTTSPVTIQNPGQAQLPPASASQQSATPTPAAILSLSDVKLQNGTVMLPPVTEAQKSNSQQGLGSGQAQNASGQTGKGDSAARNQGASGFGTTADTSGQPTSTPITLPKDGHFAAVIVGNALEQEFPEIGGVWNGRMAYTAYLHVGLAKSWILQYSLPRDTDAAPGGASRLDAPWPYNIVRPNLAPDSIDADALMIHGFINPSGRFENLSVVFPQPFSMAQFVLNALKQWQFRPAMQNGQPAKVEVLIIIPEQLE